MFGPAGRTPGIRSRQGFAAEILPRIVPKPLWPCLTKLAYERSDIFSIAEQNQELFDWERRVIERHFPRGPGKLLVAACGGGREMAVLARKGWQVAGFDPVESFLVTARELVPENRKLALERADFATFEKRLEAVEAHKPYDVFLFGWGSFSHVYEETERLRLLQAARRLCPTGPVILSWVESPEIWEERRLWREKLKHFQWGARFSGDVYDPSIGMIHDYSEREIFRFAERTGQCVGELSLQAFERYAVLKPLKKP